MLVNRMMYCALSAMGSGPKACVGLPLLTLTSPSKTGYSLRLRQEAIENKAQKIGYFGKSCRKNGVEAVAVFDIVSNMTKIAERRVSLTEQITDELRRRILNGELAAGMSLRQERLAAQLRRVADPAP